MQRDHLITVVNLKNALCHSEGVKSMQLKNKIPIWLCVANTRSSLFPEFQSAYHARWRPPCPCAVWICWQSVDFSDTVALTISAYLSAAFDTVNHTTLLQLLECSYGLHDKSLGSFTHAILTSINELSITAWESNVALIPFGIPKALSWSCYCSCWISLMSANCHPTQSLTKFDGQPSSSLTCSRLGPVACLHRVAMGTLLSRRSWSVHLVRGRPGGRFHKGSGGRPTDSSTWHSMASHIT